MVSGLSSVALLLAVLTEEAVARQLKQKGASRQETVETLASFYDAVLARERHEVLAQQRHALGSLVSMNEKRFGEGVIAERDLIRARIEASRVDLEVSQAHLALEQALARLAGLLGLKEKPSAIQIDHRFDESPAPLNREAAAYEAAREQIQTIKLRLLQQVDESYSIEKLLYEQLKTDLLTLLEAERARTEVRLAYYTALHQVATVRLRLGYLP